MKTKDYTWDHIDKMCRTYAQKIKAADQVPKQIFAIGTGGLIPGTILAKEFGCKVFNIGYTSRHDGVGSEPSSGTMYQFPENEYTEDLSNTLIVDDIWDSGHTAEAVYMFFNQDERTVPIYTMLLREGSAIPRHITHEHSEIIREDIWAQFAWEKAEDSQLKADDNQLYLNI